LLGDKHPSALGAPLREVWPEIYSELGPLNESILRGERGAFFAADQIWRVQHHTARYEDAHFSISYSPIPDDSAPNGVGGVLAIAVETTERYRTEQTLRTLTHSLESQIAERTRERDR